MKKLNLKKVTVCSSNELIGKVIDAALSSNEITRQSIKEITGASLTSIGKILAAMDESRFTLKKPLYKRDTGKLSYRHIFNDAVSVLLIDLSDRICSFLSIDASGGINMLEEYEYNTTITFNDNMDTFFSRASAAVLSCPYLFSAISLILPDKASFPFSGTSPSDLEELLWSYCSRFFKMLPFLVLNRPQAVAEAIRFNAQNKFNEALETVYLKLDSYPYAAFISKDGSAFPCNIQRLIVKNGFSLSEIASKELGFDEIYKHIPSIVNFCDSAFSPERYILELGKPRSDVAILGEFKRYYSAIALPLPVVISTGKYQSLAYLGAALSSLSSLIKLHIIPKSE